VNHRTFLSLASVGGWLLAGSFASAQIPQPTDAPKPRTPEESAAAFKLPDGFRLEVIASEPLIASPSGVCWDERGRMLVCELHGYNLEGQLDIEELNKTGQLDTQVRRVQADEKFKRAARAGTYGVVKLLRDTDGDGRMDQVDVWATHLPPAYGLVPARGGVIVACAPDIVFLADRDDDGRAEVQEKLFTGFRTGELERGVNAPQWGMDGWIYFGRGWGGGRITGPHLRAPVDLPGSDFRIRADGSAIEPVTGGTHTFGFAMTEAGDRFVVTTTIPGIFIAPLPWPYLARNPDAAAPSLEAATGDRRAYGISKPHPWRQKRADDPAYFKYYNSRYGAAESEADGWFTAACSPMIYQDSSLPGLHGHYFVCEPSGNLIHRALVKSDGAALKLERVSGEEKSEFAPSSDPWSHPMNLTHGPDGSIWVVDYYREIIEDYSAIPRHLQQQYGVYAGHDRGRIYRLTHRDAKRAPAPNLGGLDAAALARECASPFLWRRLTAQRLLLERRAAPGAPDPAEPAAGALRELLARKAAEPSALIAALRTLDQLDALTPADALPFLRHDDAAVRIHALQLAERRFDQPMGRPLLEAALSGAAAEQNPRVQIQYALSLGQTPDPRAFAALAGFARQRLGVRWMDAAVLSSLHDRGLDMLAELLRAPGGRETVAFLTPLARSIAARRKETELASALHAMVGSEPDTQAAILGGLAQGRKNAPRQPLRDKSARASLASLAASPNGDVRKATRQLEDTFGASVADDEGLVSAGQLPPLEQVSDETFRKFVAALSGPRDVQRGHELFVRACATCHRIGNEGHDVGPDLIGQLGLAEEALLKDILLPNERIRPGFETTLVQLADGRAVTGILKEDGATSLALILPGGVEQVLLRKDVTGVRRLAASLMPSFAEGLAPAEVAGLLAWLRGNLGAKPTEQGQPPVLAPFNTERATNGPMPAAEVVARMKLPPGFHLTVFASEPDVQQPIAMATDARGRLWVAENYTYSERPVGYHPQLRDRIVVFEDTDNDGHFDRRTVFWDGAQRLTSVEVGLGGVWALALPNLVFIPDENGDAIADGPPQVVLDGFEYQAGRHTIANGLRWGPDGWLYGRHGIQSTSRIGPPGTPASQRTAMNVGIWRYHPTRHVTEVVAQGTTNPWGMDWDAQGELFFINTVIGHLWHVIPGAHYRRMYGEDPTPRIYESLEQTADHVHWATGEVWTDVRKGVTDSTLAAGGGHAHTGLLIYQGGQWPDEWSGKVLAINYHGRQFNRDRLERRGSGFVGRHEPDAFRFPDPWFRGIDLIAAPDGGVFVSDWSDAGECHDEDGIHRTSGRIYKLTYGDRPAGPPADVAKLGEAELARLQGSANDWQARQARRGLADRARRGTLAGEAGAVLQRLASSDTNEVTRLRALWALHVSGGAGAEVLRTKLRGSEHERAWALRLWEDTSHSSPAEAAAFGRFLETELPQFAASESSAFVRLTLASLLQKLPLANRASLAKALLAHAEDGQDANQPLMIWYGLEPLAARPDFVELLAAARIPRTQRLGARRLAEDVDTTPERVDALITAVAGVDALATRQAVLDGIADGFAGRRQVTPPRSWNEAALQLARGADPALRSRLRDLSALFGDGRALDEIKQVALSPQADLARRRAALQSLVNARADGLRQVCEQLLPIRELSSTAAGGLALFEDPAVADRLLGEWPNLYGPERPPVLNALLSRPVWVAKLLEAMAAGRFRSTDLGVAQARQIRRLNNPDLTRRLTEAWGTLQDTDEAAKQAALRRWQQQLTPEALEQADLNAGRKVFVNACGACHKLYGEGGTLGPDLTGSGRHDREFLLDNILFPSAIVPAEFRQTTLSLKDGRSLSGIVRSRSAQAIVLQMVGEVSTVSRADIGQESTSPLSLMPEGLLDPLSAPQVADLFAYLMSTVPPAGQ
jgi:putative membrane-bound dehydrogenase-like protein